MSAAATVTVMSYQLTAEQQRKIEENRRKALERRAERLGQTVNTKKQSSPGYNSTSVNVFQPPKPSAPTGPVTISHHRETNAPKRFVPPFKKDLQSFNNENTKLSGNGKRISPSTPHNSASSRQVRIYKYANILSSVHYSAQLKLKLSTVRQKT